MKTFRKLFIITFLTTIGLTNNVFAGNSDETEIRNVRDFNAIKVSTGIDLYLKMGDTEEVKVVADDDIIDKLITEVDDGTLHIYMKKSNWTNWGLTKTRKVYVTIEKLNAVDVSSGSDVQSENTLTGENLKLRVSSGSDLSLDVVYKNLSLDASSGSDAKVTGKVKNFEAQASSGSDINAKDLECVICKVSASSGSDASIRVSDELYAKASSGADIDYYGNPQIKDIDESSGGDVSRK